jgi:thioredoxin 1
MSEIVAFHFWSPTCTPCKLLYPTIENLKEEFEGVKWVSTNTHDDSAGIARKLNVVSVPTIVVFKGNQEVGRHSGTSVIGYYTLFRRAQTIT